MDDPKPRQPARRVLLALPLLAVALATIGGAEAPAREGPLIVDLPERRRRSPPPREREPLPLLLRFSAREARERKEEAARVARAVYLAPFRAEQEAKAARRAEREAKRVAGIARAKRRSQGLPSRTLEEARAELETCVRNECRDHAFGDAEIFWDKDGRQIAEGYSTTGAVSVHFTGDTAAYQGDEARALRWCGHRGVVDRNDAGADDTRDGPPEFYEEPEEDFDDAGDES